MARPLAHRGVRLALGAHPGAQLEPLAAELRQQGAQQRHSLRLATEILERRHKVKNTSRFLADIGPYADAGCADQNPNHLHVFETNRIKPGFIQLSALAALQGHQSGAPSPFPGYKNAVSTLADIGFSRPTFAAAHARGNIARTGSIARKDRRAVILQRIRMNPTIIIPRSVAKRFVRSACLITVGVLAGLDSTSNTHAGGFRIATHDGFASARGEAFAATANNPAAIYYNPAGITQLPGHQVRAGVYALNLQTTYRAPGSGGEFDNEKDLHAVPHFFYTYGPEASALSFGLGLYAPFGLSSEWSDLTGFRTVATRGQVKYFTINPVAAWCVTPRLSLAAGVTFNYAELDLRQGLVWPAQPLDQFRFKGDGWDVGYNLGLLWQVHDKVTIGISFRSPTTVELDGHTAAYNREPFPPGGPVVPAFPEQRWAAEADWPFPLNAVFGISWRPTPDWNLEFNADFTGWNRLRTVTLRQAGGLPGLLPPAIPLTLNWEGSWYYEWGVTRYVGERWHISAGYIFNEGSVPDATYSPLVADLDRHFFSVGTGYRGPRWNWDVAYQFGYGPEHTVRGSRPSATGQSADGRYKYLSHAVIVSAGWAF